MYKYRKAVLIIHGFAGGTYDQEPLFFYLQPKLEFDVYNFTLPGHITNLANDVEYKDWIKAVDDRINTLTSMGYSKIYLIGHSMGGVLATHAAIKHPIVKKLVLIAPAFDFLSTDDNYSLAKTIKAGAEIIKTYQVKEILSRFLKVSVQQVRQFVKLVEVSQENPSLLNVPTLIIQGTNDQIVPYESSNKIYNEMHCKKWLINVDGVTHDVFKGVKVDIINKEICRFLKKNYYSADLIRKW